MKWLFGKNVNGIFIGRIKIVALEPFCYWVDLETIAEDREEFSKGYI